MTTALPTMISISVVIPSYERAPVLLDTLKQLFSQTYSAHQIIVVDQTQYHADDHNYSQLKTLDKSGKIDFIQLENANIPAAMNTGLQSASGDYVLFLDDDIQIDENFIAAHHRGLKQAQKAHGELPIAQVGQVLQPNQQPVSLTKKYYSGFGVDADLGFAFHSSTPQWIRNCMAGNLCVDRQRALSAGGFDENFVGAAYRFETEFARRMVRTHNRLVYFWPDARIHHLQWVKGGTRHLANHLSSSQAIHATGAYYFLCLQAKGLRRYYLFISQLLSSFKARFYLTKPWYLPVRLVAELRGIKQALTLARQGARRLPSENLAKTKPTRLAVLMSHPTQHFVSVYRHLANNPEIELRVFFLANNGVSASYDSGFSQMIQWDMSLLGGYEADFLEADKQFIKFAFFEVDSANVTAALAEFEPNAIWLHGYSQAANWRAIFNRAPVIYTSDSNLTDARSGWRRWLKRFLVPVFLRRCDYCIAVSPANQAYLEHYGVAPERIGRAAFPIDLGFWQVQRQSLEKDSNTRLRHQLGIAESTTLFLFVGKLQEHKRASDLVAAIASLNNLDVAALIIGQGHQYAELQAQIKTMNLQARVKLLGFINQSELAQYFELADALVFPSGKEPYGTVAAEALLFGLPIIASNQIGCIGSAIMEDSNALVYESGDVEGLTEAMRSLHEDQSLRDRLGAASASLAPQHDASSLALAISNCLHNLNRGL